MSAMITCLVAAMLATAAPESARVTPVPSQAAAPASPDSVLFWVFYTDANGAPASRGDGVRCQALRCDGIRDIGTADANGWLDVPHAVIDEPGNLALLFCGPQATEDCTAVRLDAGLVRALAEYNVRVERRMIINSVTIDAGRATHLRRGLGR